MQELNTSTKAGRFAAHFILSLGGLAVIAVLSACGSAPRCNSYHGACTGSGTKQCVVGMSSYSDPSAPSVEQCCSSSSQYPWVEACEGASAPTRGCGFCVW